MPDDVMALRSVLLPFAAKAEKWERNHPLGGTDSVQVQHRLGDFRAARTALQLLDRLAQGMVERPFAHCCAEAGGNVDACDCVRKDHGTAWFGPSCGDVAKASPYTPRPGWRLVPVDPTREMVEAGACAEVEAVQCDYASWVEKEARAIWSAMFAAAPAPAHD